MPYKTILSYVDEPERCTSQLALARTLAERHSAHLVGLHVIPNIQVYAAADTAAISVEIYEAERKSAEDVARRMKEAFVAAMKGAGCTSEWRSVEEGAEPIGDRIVEHGLVADLVITGQIDPDIRSPRRVGTPEAVLMHGGRPLLMVPYAGSFGEAGRHVAIAWNATGEAARAAFDALPFLMAADRVTILTIGYGGGYEPPDIASGHALAASLERHGVKADVSASAAGDIPVGEMILSRIADLAADILVMGGYGHSRLSEFLFGGATRDILREMTVPVLIAH